jgi:hypothetical protein
MSESLLWLRLRKKIGPFGHFNRIENSVVAGTPDVSFCINGIERFIELKYKNKFPANVKTPVFKRGGLRKAQIIWHYRRTKAGGKSFILSQIGSLYLLHEGQYALSYNVMTKQKLISTAKLLCPSHLQDPRILVEQLII